MVVAADRPTPLKLDDLFEVRKEMSGAMYDTLISFLRKKKVPIGGTRDQVRAAMKEAAFEYETGHFTSVDTKEVEVHGRKVSKEVKSHGYYLRVKDPLVVLQQSAAVHAAEGRMAWPPNVPADVYPVTIVLDAGGGHQASSEPAMRFWCGQCAAYHAACNAVRCEGHLCSHERGVRSCASCRVRVESRAYVCDPPVEAAAAVAWEVGVARRWLEADGCAARECGCGCG